MHERGGFFGRLGRLLRGMFGLRLSAAEARNAEVVYHNAIRGQQAHRDKLKQALGRLVYLRNKSEAALEKERDHLELVERALRDAAIADNDDRALALLEKRNQLRGSLDRHEVDLERYSEQAREAKTALADLDVSVNRLKTERDEMLARKAHALARRDIQSTLDSAMAPHSVNMQALENVRESIAMLESQAGLSESRVAEGEDLGFDTLKRQDADRRNREALQAMKMELKGRMLPSARPSQPLSVNKEEVVV